MLESVSLWRRLVPAMASVALLGGTGHPVLEAASEAERDQHFDTVAQVIDKELYLVAKRAMEAYKAASYPDPSGHYSSGLRLHYANTFSIVAGVPEAEALAAEAKNLMAKLKADADKLPSRVRAYAQGSSKVRKLANRVLNDFNPDAPPPIVPWSPDRVNEVKSRISILKTATEAAMAEDLKAVTDFDTNVVEKDDAPTDGKAYQEMIQKAILLRTEFLTKPYLTIQALKEVSYRGTDFGMDQAWIKQEVDSWIIKTISARVSDLDNWEWNYGYMYLYLRHKIAAMLGEIVRQKVVNKDMVTGVETQYDTVIEIFQGCVDTDLKQFSKKYQLPMKRYMVTIWRDMLAMHLQMGTKAAAKKGIALFQSLQQRGEEDRLLGLASSDRRIASLMGSIYIYAARLYLAAGDTGTYNALLADVQSPKYKNIYASNAKSWITRPGKKSSSSWSSQPRPIDPNRAITVAKAFIGEARRSVDEKMQLKFYTDAAASLRDGILGLPENESDPDFIELAPSVYQLYAYTLHKRGWAYRAAVATLEGLGRFRPEEWSEEGLHKNWSTSGGSLSASGNMIRRLAGDAMVYTQSLTSKAGGAVAKASLQKAIEFMRTYDPENVEADQDFLEIIIFLQEKQYADARDAAKRVANERMKKDKVAALKALRYAVESMYQLWQQEIEKDRPDETKIQKANDELEKWVNVLAAQTDPNKVDTSKMKPETARIFQRGWQMVNTVRVGRLFKSKQYDNVITLLDNDFWAKAPNDAELVKKLLNYLTGSAYTLNLDSRKAMKAAYDELKSARRTEAKAEKRLALVNGSMKDVLKHWKAYKHAHRVYASQLAKYPTLAVEAVNMRKQLSSIYSFLAMNQLSFIKKTLPGMASDPAVSKGLLETWLDGKQLSDVDPGLADELADGKQGMSADQAVLDYLIQVSQGKFADLYYGILKETEEAKPDNIIATADSLWSVDDKVRAVELYERYLETIAADQRLKQLLENPREMIEAAKKGAAPTNALQLWWRHKKGNISDFLIDEPNFITDFYDNNAVSQDQWPEEKQNFARAYNKLKDYRNELVASKARISNYDEVIVHLDEFMDVVKGLALSIKVQTRLVEAYMEIGQSGKAVALASELYKYDPLNSTYMKAVVDGVLLALPSGEVTEKQKKDAQLIAAKLRNKSKEPRDYWISSMQVLELSKALGEAQRVNKALGVFERSNRHPAEQLMKPVSKDFNIGRLGEGEAVFKKNYQGKEVVYGRLSRGDMQIVRRFLRLFEIGGVTVKPFVTIEETIATDSEDANIKKKVFIVRSNKTKGGAQ